MHWRVSHYWSLELIGYLTHFLNWRVSLYSSSTRYVATLKTDLSDRLELSHFLCSQEVPLIVPIIEQGCNTLRTLILANVRSKIIVNLDTVAGVGFSSECYYYHWWRQVAVYCY